MVTSLMCIVSTTLRMTSTGQGEPAMMPVRKLLRSKRANSGCSSMAMNIVGHAVQAGASLGLHRLQRRHGIESFGRAHHAGAVGDAGEVAQHHAEAMIIGHRNAQAIVGREAHGLADEIAVVQDVVVGQRRALGRAGGSRGELDVDRVVELKRRLEGHEFGALGRRRGLGDLIEIEHARRLVRAEADDELELRQALGPELARLGRVDFGRAGPERGEIVVVLVASGSGSAPGSRIS